MSQDLTVRLNLDDTASQRAVNAWVASMKRAEAASDRAAKAAEAAFKRKQDAADRAAQRLLAATQRELTAAIKSAEGIARANIKAAEASEKAQRKQADAQARTAQRAADAVAKAHQVAADAQAKFEQKSADAATKAAVAKSRASQRAAQAGVDAAQKKLDAEIRANQRSVQAEQDRVAILQKLGAQQLSREEVQLRARAQANSKFQQRRVDDLAKVMLGEKDATSQLDKFIESGTSMAAGFVGVGTIIAGFRAVGKEITDTREKQIAYAEELLKTKNDLKEIAVLKGLAFADNDFVKQMSAFSQKTGMSISQADEFQRNLFGSSEGGIQKGNVDKETLEKAAVLTGKAAVRQTKDVATRGDLVGLLTQLHDYKHDKTGKEVSSEDAAKAIAVDAESVRLGLTEGRGDDSVLTKAFANVAGSLAGDGMPVPSSGKLGSVIGVMSLSAGPGMADTRAEQYVRGLRGNTPKQMEFMKQFTGREEHDNIEVQGDKLHKAMEKVKASGRDATEFLVESGVPEEQVKALVEGDRNYDVLKKRYRKAEDPVKFAQIEKDNAAFAASALGKKTFGEADKKAAELEQGKVREALEAEMPAAESELIKEGLGTDLTFSAGNYMRTALSGHPFSALSGSTDDGKKVRIEQRALERLRKQAGGAFSPQELAFGAPTNPIGAYSAMSATGQTAEAANFYKMLIDVNRRQLEEQQKANAARNNQPVQQQAQPALNAQPAPPMQRP